MDFTYIPKFLVWYFDSLAELYLQGCPASSTSTVDTYIALKTKYCREKAAWVVVIKGSMIEILREMLIWILDNLAKSA